MTPFYCIHWKGCNQRPVYFGLCEEHFKFHRRNVGVFFSIELAQELRETEEYDYRRGFKD